MWPLFHSLAISVYYTNILWENYWHVQVMEKELMIELCVCSYYAYKNIWEAAIREELPCERETRNTKDRYAIPVKKDGSGQTSNVKKFRG